MLRIEELLKIMARLRDPDGGCPWDLEQTFETIAPYTIEEAYEVEDAIRRGDWSALPGELGDLLLQVVYHAQLAEEEGQFDFADVVAAICDKLVERHPHVFGDAEIASAADQLAAWEGLKAEERAESAAREGQVVSTLDGVPVGLPALTRAAKLQDRARRAGFRWPGPGESLAKLEEEVRELREAAVSSDPAQILDELGDVFFSCASAAAELGVDPETAVRAANAKFEARFRRLEATLLDRGEPLSSKTPDELIRLWRELKSED
ncbi:MAG: nucleoside triphosphate pyrophosphohydrolase [Myxococcota bacterium]